MNSGYICFVNDSITILFKCRSFHLSIVILWILRCWLWSYPKHPFYLSHQAYDHIKVFFYERGEMKSGVNTPYSSSEPDYEGAVSELMSNSFRVWSALQPLMTVCCNVLLSGCGFQGKLWALLHTPPSPSTSHTHTPIYKDTRTHKHTLSVWLWAQQIWSLYQLSYIQNCIMFFFPPFFPVVWGSGCSSL